MQSTAEHVEVPGLLAAMGVTPDEFARHAHTLAAPAKTPQRPKRQPKLVGPPELLHAMGDFA